MRHRILSVLIMAGLISGAFGFNAATEAAVIDLGDGNATARFDSTDARVTLDWVVDTVDQLFQQTFFVSVNGAPQLNVTALDANPTVATANTNFDPRPERTTITWTGQLVQVSAQFTLSGGNVGTGDATMSEIIRVTNTDRAPISLRLFQYVDMDMTNTPADDTALAVGPLYNMIRQYDVNSSVGETVVTPGPTAYEVNTVSSGTNIITRLNNNAVLASLTNGAGPVVGDVEWAFQWDRLLQPGEELLISKVKSINATPFIPEPASLTLLGLGGLLALRRRARA